MSNITSKDVLYSDFTIGFDIHPTKKDLVRVLNEGAVKRAIRNLLLTNRGERFFRPQVGSRIRSYLFEPMTPFTAVGLRQEIEETINNYEPRVQLINVAVDPLYDQNAYNVKLTFYILNKPDPVSYNVALERIR
jgi:phage baseplate assembly protein W